MTGALVLFSGGTGLGDLSGLALHRFERVETIGFDYRQRHRAELRAREIVRDELRSAFPDWGPKLGDDHLLDLGVSRHQRFTQPEREWFSPAGGSG